MKYLKRSRVEVLKCATADIVGSKLALRIGGQKKMIKNY